MVRLAEILKKQEMDRVYFSEDKPVSIDKLSSGSKALTDEELYKELLGLMRQVLLDILNAKQLNFTLLKDKISLLSEFISKDDGALLKLIERHYNSEDYLVVHGVNVCILSLEIARALNYSREAMLDLGLGAFLHDIGMIKIRNILQNKRRLYAAEYDEVKNHVTYGLDILNNLGPINERVSCIISQHHERIDGSGYLNGLSGDQIHEYAQIVGLADVYEALIHSRPHRKRFVPFEYETIKEIISHRDMFEPYILRGFLERLTRQPAYMLWLATHGIYEILKHQDNLRASLEIKPQIKTPSKKRYVLSAIILLIGLIIGISTLLKSDIHIPKKEIFYPLGSSLGIADNRQPLKIVYNFTDNISVIPSASLDISGINLDGYHFLTFSSKVDDKKTNKMRYATLKIAVENARKETSNYYVQGISNRWKEFRIPLSYFEAIKDWSSVVNVSFVLQPWNIDGKEGALYIDDIHFFRKK